MAELVGIIIATALYVATPGYLIGSRFGFELGVCAALLGAVLLAMFHLLQEIKKQIENQKGHQ